MKAPASTGIVFVALAVILIGVALWDYLMAEGKMTIARKIWIRMAIIFAAVGIGLFFAQIFFFQKLGHGFTQVITDLKKTIRAKTLVVSCQKTGIKLPLTKLKV